MHGILETLSVAPRRTVDQRPDRRFVMAEHLAAEARDVNAFRPAGGDRLRERQGFGRDLDAPQPYRQLWHRVASSTMVKCDEAQ
ncbi:hypothetical protein [Erythrobacter sp. THAF29]|uniref:hypothetical protein n=1 Tax=Erythrobacter sp. THAF29 TaxID=2587851 RepID=UPI0015626A9F|nr:hypothetical protein [Erythrobacter sp. THAF29]